MGPIWALYAIFMLVPCGLFENGPTWWQYGLPRLKPSWPNALPIWFSINYIATSLGQHGNQQIWFCHIETTFFQCNISFKRKITLTPCQFYATFCLPLFTQKSIWPMGTRWFGGQEVAGRMLHRYNLGPMWFSIQMECFIGRMLFQCGKTISVDYHIGPTW